MTSAPPGITCGTACSASYTSGTAVTLTATAVAGSVFAGWSEGGCSGTGACMVSMTQARTVTATFAPALPALTLSLNQSTIRTGDTLRVGLKAQNPGPAFQTDFYFGVLLPDGITLFFFTGLSPINGVVTQLDANPKTFQTLVSNILIPQGLDVTIDDILVVTFDANFPPGTYIFFTLLTPPGVFTDGRVDTGDILVIDAKSLSFGP